MSIHYQTRCIECDKIISECKCLIHWKANQYDRPITWLTCQACKTKTELEHKCDSCIHEYPTCTGNPTFGIDIYKELAFKIGADTILSCDEYVKSLEINSPCEG
jgi:hypothetical protein